MVKVLGATQFVDHLEIILPPFGDAVKEYVLIDGTFDTTFGAGAIVARHVDEDGVIGVGQLLHGVDDAAHFVVAFRAVGGEHFHHAGIEPLLIRVESVPCR